MTKITMGGGSKAQRNGHAIHPVLGSLGDVRQEIDQVHADMRRFKAMQPDEVMLAVSGWSARLSEIRTQIYRIEDMSGVWKELRVREVEPTIKELKDQYDIASRRLTFLQFDWELAKGGP